VQPIALTGKQGGSGWSKRRHDPGSGARRLPARMTAPRLRTLLFGVDDDAGTLRASPQMAPVTPVIIAPLRAAVRFPANWRNFLRNSPREHRLRVRRRRGGSRDPETSPRHHNSLIQTVRLQFDTVPHPVGIDEGTPRSASSDSGMSSLRSCTQDGTRQAYRFTPCARIAPGYQH
jgi:hypothetical protein